MTKHFFFYIILNASSPIYISQKSNQLNVKKKYSLGKNYESTLVSEIAIFTKKKSLHTGDTESLNRIEAPIPKPRKMDQ